MIGEWWTLLILRDAFLGVTRFDDFAKRLGIARNVLTARLDTLVDNDVLTASPTTRPAAATTTASRTRASPPPVMTAIRQWGDEWILGEDHAPIVVEHTTCGHLSKGVLTCDHCAGAHHATLGVPRGPGFHDDLGLLPVDADEACVLRPETDRFDASAVPGCADGDRAVGSGDRGGQRRDLSRHVRPGRARPGRRPPRRAGRGGPALELAVGTGRVALPLTERGVEVHGIELSAPMVEHRARSLVPMQWR